MARNPQIVVEYVAKTAALKSGLDDAAKHTSGFSDKLKGIAKGGVLAAGAAGLGALTGALKIGIGEWKDSTKISAQTKAVLKSTGDVAHVSAGHVDKLATSLMKKSGVDDEAVKSGENLLLTFTNVRNEAGKGNKIFDQATKAALDMSTAMGTDPKTAAMQLGKALNDPEKGVAKLTRSGVTFTDQQKDQIKKLQESGHTLKAQKIILGEVNKEFGGSAAAAGKTLPGQLNILKQEFNNLAGDLVGKLIPVLQNTITWLRDHWPEISKAFQTMWNTVKPILDNLWGLLKAVAGAVSDAWPAILPIVESLGKVVQDAAKIIGSALKLVVDLIHGNWKQAWTDVKSIVSTALDLVKSYLQGAPAVMAKLALALGKAIFDGIKDGVTGVASWIGDRIQNIKDAITGAVTSVFNAAKNLGGKVFDGIKDGVTGVASWVGDRIQNVLEAIHGFEASIYNTAKRVGAGIYNGIKDGVSGIGGAIASAIGSAINAAIDLINKIHIPAIKVLGHKVFPGLGFNIGHVALAEGGIVTRPTLALIGEAGPEAVVPLSGGGSSPAVQVRVFIGDTELRGLVRNEVVDATTGIARTVLAGAG